MRKCPKCQSQSSVTDSRERRATVRRIRQCVKCSHRWTTYESMVESSLASRVEEFADEARDLAKDISSFKIRIQHLEGELVALGDDLRAALDGAPPSRRLNANGARGVKNELA